MYLCLNTWWTMPRWPAATNKSINTATWSVPGDTPTTNVIFPSHQLNVNKQARDVDWQDWTNMVPRYLFHPEGIWHVQEGVCTPTVPLFLARLHSWIRIWYPYGFWRDPSPFLHVFLVWSILKFFPDPHQGLGSGMDVEGNSPTAWFTNGTKQQGNLVANFFFLISVLL